MKLEIYRNSSKESTESQSDNNSAPADGKKSQKIFRRSLSPNFGRKSEDSLYNKGKIFPNKISSFEFPKFWKFKDGKYRTAFPAPELSENCEKYQKMIWGQNMTIKHRTRC